jgi:hemerythrin superfamily protein
MPAQTSAAEAAANTVNAINLLKQDHKKVTTLFRQFKSAGSSEDKTRLAREICTELTVHTLLEEEIFYAACREAKVEDSALDEAQVEHDGAKLLIAELQRQRPDSPFYDAKMTVLSEYIKHHVGEEEKPGDGIFAKARAAKLDLNALGQRLTERKEELLKQAREGKLESPVPRSLDLQSIPTDRQETPTMGRLDRDRDEQGRFTGDDDGRNGGRDYASRSGGRGEQGRYMSDDDDRNGGGRGGYSSRSNERERDDEGRFTSNDDRGGGRSSYRDDERSGGYQSRGGGSRYQEEDNRSYGGGGERGRSSWNDDQRQDRGGYENRGGGMEGRERGRYENSDDYSRGAQDGRGGGRGWFGDSEGHSRAAEQRWEDRGGGGHGRSSRDDDQDDRGSRGGRQGSQGGQNGQGQGGWFGDSRGHADAARRGWQNR